MSFEDEYKSWSLQEKLEFHGCDIEVTKEGKPRIMRVRIFEDEFVRIYDEGPGVNDFTRFRVVLHSPLDEDGERKGWRITSVLQTDHDDIVVLIVNQLRCSFLRL